MEDVVLSTFTQYRELEHLTLSASTETPKRPRIFQISFVCIRTPQPSNLKQIATKPQNLKSPTFRRPHHFYAHRPAVSASPQQGPRLRGVKNSSPSPSVRLTPCAVHRNPKERKDQHGTFWGERGIQTSSFRELSGLSNRAEPLWKPGKLGQFECHGPLQGVQAAVLDVDNPHENQCSLVSAEYFSTESWKLLRTHGLSDSPGLRPKSDGDLRH